MYATTILLNRQKTKRNKEKMIMVKYFIPEDGDDEEHPNVFSVTAFLLANLIYLVKM